jgi:hypothetical protein
MVATTTAQATTTVNAAACCSHLNNPYTVDGEIFLGLAYSSLLLLFLFYSQSLFQVGLKMHLNY